MREAGVKVVLTSYELLVCCIEGGRRNIEDIEKGIKPKYGAGFDMSWQKDIHGACCEMALAKHKELPWSKGEMWEDDVGPFQVRGAGPKGRLILHPSDADDKKFYFVRGEKNVFVIKGWILAKDGKQERFWCNPKGDKDTAAFFVPVNALNPYVSKDD